MDMAQRIQQLRRSKGLSQEELAGRLGVSRQAVSKWEGGQSAPDAEKIVALSEGFGVTTDWLLKGVEPAEEKGGARRKLAGRILFAASPAFVAAGLLLAVAGEWEGSTFVRCAGLIVQVMGVALYFIGRVLTGEKGPFWAAWLDVACIAFLPVRFVMGWGVFLTPVTWFVPFEAAKIVRDLLCWPAYLAVLAVSFLLLKKRK
ncbi:MAG TPA: helix-turn-helix domain-containing protein [Candidatus Fournierella merdavium]|nr:helix-turn-helix domain-containing protein [Candidatus Fournierella merdavium]